jgi:hypothetical protein
MALLTFVISYIFKTDSFLHIKLPTHFENNHKARGKLNTDTDKNTVASCLGI